MKLRRLLVAVEFPAEADQPGLDKALMLAAEQGASVEVCHIAWDSSAARFPDGATLRDIDYVVALRRTQLERLVAARVRRGRGRPLRVTFNVQWARPAHEAIVAAADACGADLIVGQSSRHGASRYLLTYTDWQLIRHARRPLLLVKSATAWKARTVVAAIDPLHAHDKPAALDRQILGMAGLLARSQGLRLHAFHAFEPAVRFVPGTALEPLPVLAPPADQRRHERAVRARVLRVTRAARLPASRVRIVQGEAARALPEFVDEVHGGVAVLGSVTRGLLQRWMIGSTAERVLDAINCDVLVVPPPAPARRGTARRR